MSDTSIRRNHFSIFLISFVSIMCLLSMTFGIIVTADKTPTNLSIQISPNEPDIGEPYYIKGILTDMDGKGLGNKRIILQLSTTKKEDAAFENIDIDTTDRDGSYSFFRNEKDNPELIRVVYSGNDQFSPVTSEIISIRGAGTDHPIVRTNVTGTIKISTEPQGAEIFVDDIFQGMTPYTVSNLLEGDHTLTLSKKGYKNETTEAYVTSKIDTSYAFSLEKDE